MKAFTLLFCLTICFAVSGATYYVAPNGNDDNPGTITQPWKTWRKAFTSTSVKAGDTVYFRGGVYQPSRTNGSGEWVTRAGTSTNWIVYMNYPGEVPILDCSNVDPGRGGYNYGFGANFNNGANYIKFKGLTVRNVLQVHSDEFVEVYGVMLEGAGNFIAENCKAYNIEGRGFSSYFFGEQDGDHRFINCDAWNIVDYGSPRSLPPGNRGTGFNAMNWTGTGGHTYYINCRAWKCSDQGFGDATSTYQEFDGCWAFNNGVLGGDGSGFKLGWHDYSYPGDRVNLVVKNCIAAFNRAYGFVTNDEYGKINRIHVYNNIAYRNGYKGGAFTKTGFMIMNTESSTADEQKRIFRNNIAYNDEGGAIYMQSGASYTHSHNSWDIPLSFTNTDFLSVDSTGLAGPRKADGSLPDLKFLKLSEKSKAIDAGIDVGLEYNDKAPDLGFSEYGSSSTPTTPTTPVVPVYVSSVMENATPSRLEMTYNLTLANIVPAASSFTVRVNSATRNVSSVSISGTKVLLTLANPVVYGDVVTVAYTKPPNNPLQTPTGGQAATLSAQSVTNKLVAPSNKAPNVSITSPTNGSTITGQTTITITANASDTDGTVTKVEFYRGSTKLGEKTSSPWSFTWNNVAPGTYNLTAVATDNSNDKTTSSTVRITVENSSQVVSVSGITVTGQGGVSVINGLDSKLQLIADISPANASNKNINWSIQNGTGRATINSSGVVTSVREGTVTAKATARDGSGVSGTLTLTIVNPHVAVETIVVYGAGYRTSITEKGGSLQMFANVFPENVTNKSVTWSLSGKDSEIATISSSGLLTAKADGQVTVKASATDNSGVSGIINITIKNQSSYRDRDSDLVSVRVGRSHILIQIDHDDMYDHISIYTMTGSLVLHRMLTGTELSIDRSYLRRGNYLVVLWGKGGRKTVKISIP